MARTKQGRKRPGVADIQNRRRWEKEQQEVGATAGAAPSPSPASTATTTTDRSNISCGQVVSSKSSPRATVAATNATTITSPSTVTTTTAASSTNDKTSLRQKCPEDTVQVASPPQHRQHRLSLCAATSEKEVADWKETERKKMALIYQQQLAQKQKRHREVVSELQLNHAEQLEKQEQLFQLQINELKEMLTIANAAATDAASKVDCDDDEANVTVTRTTNNNNNASSIQNIDTDKLQQALRKAEEEKVLAEQECSKQKAEIVRLQARVHSLETELEEVQKEMNNQIALAAKKKEDSIDDPTLSVASATIQKLQQSLEQAVHEKDLAVQQISTLQKCLNDVTVKFHASEKEARWEKALSAEREKVRQLQAYIQTITREAHLAKKQMEKVLGKRVVVADVKQRHQSSSSSKKRRSGSGHGAESQSTTTTGSAAMDQVDDLTNSQARKRLKRTVAMDKEDSRSSRSTRQSTRSSPASVAAASDPPSTARSNNNTNTTQQRTALRSYSGRKTSNSRNAVVVVMTSKKKSSSSKSSSARTSKAPHDDYLEKQEKVKKQLIFTTPPDDDDDDESDESCNHDKAVELFSQEALV